MALERTINFRPTKGTMSRADALVDYVYKLLSPLDPGRGDRSSVLRLALDRGLESLECDAAEEQRSLTARVGPVSRELEQQRAMSGERQPTRPSERGNITREQVEAERLARAAKAEEREAAYMASVSADIFAEDADPNTPPF